MEPYPASRDSLSPTCSMSFFDCFSASTQPDRAVRTSVRLGVEKDMIVMYQQPHLVPPMKLTVWDELPSTPTPPPSSHISQWVSHGRNMASRASNRASLSVRRKTPVRPIISTPRAMASDEGDFVFRPRKEYRPLELSIYRPNNRLSDLPEFDRLSFTDVGEIRLPPRALLLRTKSEEHLNTRASGVFQELSMLKKPASMFEGHHHRRYDTISTVISMSRPPSEYDALHSHPVSCSSLTDLPHQAHMAHNKPEISVTILSPMQEEFTPPATSMMIDGMVLDFPEIEAKNEVAHTILEPDTEEPAPSPKISSTAANSHNPTDQEPHPSASYFHTNYQTQKRISQWLAARSHSSSFSTIKSTTSTCSSFAEHRRKRSQFYQLSASHAPPPQPLQLVKFTSHHRTATVSTVASTIDTDIMSLEDADANVNANASQTSMTTAPQLDSRTGTIKSVNHGSVNGPRYSHSHNHGYVYSHGYSGGAGTGLMVHAATLRPIVSGVPDLPPCYGEVVAGKDFESLIMVQGIGRPVRSPGVGIAF